MKKKLNLDELDLDNTYTDEELTIIKKHLKIPISRQLGNWNIQTDQNGIVTTSQGGFNFSPSNRRKNILAPDVAFTSEETYLKLDEKQLWSFDGQRFTPEFVVEVAIITNDAILNEFDNRMKNDYFGAGTSVKLGWLIDPTNSIIWVYKKNNNENSPTRRKCNWENLDGGNVLPGFTLDVSKIDDILLLEEENDKKEDGKEDDKEDEEECPYCNLKINNVHNMMKHLDKVHLNSN
ncbi:hypothetical protein C1645_811994 [Glomus cerebriforme]|uniref:C2H2-type domain-containing protein n=1 Tax=Glomus cerebriforme TaxID=658196 RepID=A0A397TVX9_9GLOM|nr:hypothetical protein C1645_811994 [Glomus cerebriforme]